MFKILLITPLLIFNSVGKPLAESYSDERGQIVYSKVYNYTKDGRIKNETEYGNLTGGNFNPILIDDNGLPKPDQTCDQYTLRYRYSENSVSISDEKGGEFKTAYKDKTSFPEAQYFYNSQGNILQRWFYQYDPSGSLVEWMTDDGISENPNDLKGLSKRTIFRLTGKTIEEWALEGTKDVLKQRVVHSLVNKVSRTEIFDSEARSLGWSEQISDDQGRLTEERDSTGYTTTYEYHGDDEITQKIGDLSLSFNHHLLTQITDTSEQSMHWEYHPDGRLASYFDEEGNKTEYRWEENDLIQIDPLVEDENNIPYHPTWKYTYDCFGNLKSLVSPKGETTSYTYTSRGQAAQITFSDGTREMFKYDPEGTLHRHRSQNGKTIVYEYNDFGGLQHKEVYGPSSKNAGAFLGAVRFNHENQTAEWINKHINKCLSIEFDEENFNILDYEKKTLIKWSPQKPSRRNIYYGNGLNDFWIEEENRIYSPDGTLIYEPIVQSEEKNPNIYVDTIDVRGRLKKHEHPLRSVEYSYDPHDNLAREKYLRVPNEGLSTHFIIGYDWGPNDRLKEYWLQAPEKKIGYQHTSLGNVKQRTFGDQNLNYRYDTQGSLYKIYTKDPNQPISTFEFYENGQLAASLSGIEIERQFSNTGYLISKKTTSPNHFPSFNLRHKRDRLGRITRIELPDRTYIEYVYDGPFIALVRRLNSDKMELYSHSVTKRNLQGHIEEEILIGITGTSTHNWTPEGKLTSIQTPLFSQAISSNGTLLETHDPTGSFTTRYSYDALSRLVEEEGFFNHTYTYDSIDNCIRKDGIAININDLNQLLDLETINCEYNPKGNLFVKNKVQKIHYNVFDQPNKIEFAKANQILYRYDAHGRWIERQVNEPQKNEEDEDIPPVQSFLYLDRTPIGVIDDNGTITALKIPLDPQHPERSPSIAFELIGKTFAPIYDLFGNLALLLDPKTATVSESYRYSAFGEEALFDANQHPIPKSKLANPWRYRDRYKDDETGLIYFDLRFYDPSLMRWITPDPLGPIDGPNLYAFLRNNPIGHHDYSGLTTDSFNEYFYGEYETHCFCEEHRHCKRGGSVQSFAAGIAIGINDFTLATLEPIAQIGTRINIADLDCTPLEREALLAIAEESGLRLRENLKLGIEELLDVDPHDEIAEKYAQRTLLTLQVADFLRGNVRDHRKILSFAKTHSLKKAAFRFPKNPDDLLPSLPRTKNGKLIYVSENLCIRIEQHAMKPGEKFNARHHGLHYHVEVRKDPNKSWNNKDNIVKLKPHNYEPGKGSGFLPDEYFPGVLNE